MPSAPSNAPQPSTGQAAATTNITQAVVFICLSVAAFVACAVVVFLLMWWCWRKTASDPRMRRQPDEPEPEPSVKKQVRLPVVIINPDDDVEYGRKESRFFPALPPPAAKEGVGEPDVPELPHTPPPGAYYMEGTPGFFEVDLEMSRAPRTPSTQLTPRSKSMRTPREVLSAAVAMLVPRS